ncbi:MAG TPA: inorganic diphosphatase [Kofleriaceae bacterium]|nr:inorganic diphosphatase [Kofleriaceae bacterium]
MADLSLPPFAKDDVVNVVVETPAGSRIKYTWQPDLEVFKVTKVLASGLRFPHDFGFVPGTRTADGAPLDALVLADGPLAVGCLVECRVLGAFTVETSDEPGGQKVRNDRLVVVPEPSLRGRSWHELRDLGESMVVELGGFLRSYVEREGRTFELKGTVGPSEALTLVRRARA